MVSFFFPSFSRMKRGGRNKGVVAAKEKEKRKRCLKYGETMLHRNNGRERQTETEEKKKEVCRNLSPDKITSAVDPNRQTVGVVDNSSMCIK